MSSKLSVAMEPDDTATAELQPQAQPSEVDIAETAEQLEIRKAATWVMATKQVGAYIAGWQITERFEDKTRVLAKSERCQVTSFCYPAGAKLVAATVAKEVEEG